MSTDHLTPRERFVRILTNRQVDRSFRFQLGYWPETLNLWKEDIPEKNPDHFFEMDRIDYVPLISTFTSPYYPLFETALISEDEETRTTVGKDGIKKKQIKKDIFLSMPQFLEFPVKNKDDYERLRFRLEPNTEGRIGTSLAELKNTVSNRDYPLGMYICGGFAHPREMMGLENYLVTLHEQPDLIHTMMRDWLHLYKVLAADIIKNANLDFVYFWEDMCYKGGPLLSPKMYAEFIFPYLKELIDSIKNLGIQIIILDTDGDMTRLIPWFIKSGVNVLLPFEVQSGMDINLIRDQYPDLGIIGGIDKRALSKGKKAIEAEVLSKVPRLYRSGRYIVSLDHSVPPDVPFENYKYYIDILRSLE